MEIIQGDCIEEMKKLEENSIDAIITDPPYGIGFMGKEWDNFKPSTIKEGMEKDKRPKTQIASTRISNIAGTYDLSLTGNLKFQKWFELVAIECLRVLKPGGYLLSFGGTRTYHRMAIAIEDSGFEIRDTIMWLYGSGFPKSLNIGKSMDKMLGYERKQIPPTGGLHGGSGDTVGKFTGSCVDNIPLSKEAKEWEGWGTSIKPSFEPVVWAQKPLNTLNHIDILCRLIGYVKNVERSLKLKVVGLREGKETIVQENVQIQQEEEKENLMEIGKVEDLKEVMDTFQFLQKEVNTNLNMILSWKKLLEEIYKEMNKSTISMESEMTTELKILNSLLYQNIQNYIIKEESQVNGNQSNVSLVENLLKSLLLKSRLLNITSVQESVSGTVQEKDKSLQVNEVGNLNPNCEPIVVARKPLSEKNVALNVLKWGTGGINIDACRIGSEGGTKHQDGEKEYDNEIYGKGLYKDFGQVVPNLGRFPANIILDEEAGKYMPDTEEDELKQQTLFGEILEDENKSASRFFYCAKAGKEERNYGCEELDKENMNMYANNEGVMQMGGASLKGEHKQVQPKKNNHPTVKPIKLMEYLVKLVTKEGAVVLDPFLGSGTTAIACIKQRRGFIGIEREEEYIKIINARIKPYLEQTKL